MRPRTTPVSPERGSATAVIGILIVSLLWLGMILGVSFLATPVKFLAPSLALPVALDVGRHTFRVFNLVEIGWSFALLGFALLGLPLRRVYALIAVPCGIVALTTAWLLPVLDVRVGVIIVGGAPPGSDLHLLYIVLEVVKLAALLALGFWSLRHLARAARSGTATPSIAGR